MPSNDSPRVSRRSILIGTGIGVVGVGVGGAYLGSRSPEIELANADLGTTGPKVLVAYDSQYGSTGGVATAIGAHLALKAHVHVRHITEVSSVEDYAAVVFGSPVQRSQMKESAVEWLGQQSASINQRPMAMFMPSASFGIDPDKASQRAEKLELMQQAASDSGTSPVSMLPMGGLVDFSLMSPITSVVYRVTAGNGTEGDFRDFDAVKAWTEEITPQLGL
ncbi:MAG: flavodoxin domain-containing protein [Arachnia sp.]